MCRKWENQPILSKLMDCEAAATSKVHSVTQSHATTLSGGYPVALAKRSWVYTSCSCCLLPTSCIKICHIEVNAMIRFLDSISLNLSWVDLGHWRNTYFCETIANVFKQIVVPWGSYWRYWSISLISPWVSSSHGSFAPPCSSPADATGSNQDDVQVFENVLFVSSSIDSKSPFSPHQCKKSPLKETDVPHFYRLP